MTQAPDEREAIVREVRCPRCHEQCGWCSDYRHMHGTLRMPNDKRKRYCTIPAMAPEGDDCLLCGGTMRVIETRSYSRLEIKP